MTTTIRSDASGTFGALQVNGADVIRFGADNSGALSGFRNTIINGNFQVNQRVYVSGAAVGTNLYGHDRWKMAASSDTYTFVTALNVTTVTIPAGKVLQQVIEGLNLQSGTYTLSWVGTAQGKIGAGAYGASGTTGTAVGGTNLTIEFGPGTVSKVQLEFGSIATPFENRPYGLELSLCQRYYYRVPYGIAGQVFGSGFNQTTSTAYIFDNFPVAMRIPPPLLEHSGVATDYRVNVLNSAVVCTSTPGIATCSTTSYFLLFTTAATLIAGQGCLGACQNTNAFLGLSSEL